MPIPDQIRTERLVLRAPCPGDGLAVNGAVKESLAELRVWMPWAQKAPSVEESELFSCQSRIAWLERKSLQFLGFQHEKLVLSIGLHDIDWTVPKFEIGYWLRTSATGQGLMTEAVIALTQFATTTLKARRIEIRCDSNNERSRRVAERAGFKLEATFNNDRRWVDGTLSHTCVFATTRDDAQHNVHGSRA